MKILIMLLFYSCFASIGAIDFSLYADYDDSRLRMDYGDMCLYADIFDQIAAAGLLNEDYEYVLGFLGRGKLAGFISGDWKRPARPGIRSGCLPGSGARGEVFCISDADGTAGYPGLELRTRGGLVGYTSEGLYGAVNLGQGMLSLYAGREPARDSDGWYLDEKADTAVEAGGWSFVPSFRWSEKWITLQASAILGEYTMPRYKGGISLAASTAIGDFASSGAGLWAVYEYIPGNRQIIHPAALPDGGVSLQLSMGNVGQELRLLASAAFTDTFLKADARAAFHSDRAFVAAGARSIELFGVYEPISGKLPGLYVNGGYKGPRHSYICSLAYKDRVGCLNAGVALGVFSISAGCEAPFQNTKPFSLENVQITRLTAKWTQDWGYLKVQLDSKQRLSLWLKIGIIDADVSDFDSELYASVPTIDPIIDEYSE